MDVVGQEAAVAAIRLYIKEMHAMLSTIENEACLMTEKIYSESLASGHSLDPRLLERSLVLSPTFDTLSYRIQHLPTTLSTVLAAAVAETSPPHELNFVTENDGSNEHRTTCFICRTAFNFIRRRRHHCHRCRQAICDRCSVFEKISVHGEKERVCTMCVEDQDYLYHVEPVLALVSTNEDPEHSNVTKEAVWNGVRQLYQNRMEDGVAYLDLFTNLERLFVRSANIGEFEFYTAQWSTLITAEKVSASFVALILKMCTYSVHFALLLQLATRPSPTAKALSVIRHDTKRVELVHNINAALLGRQVYTVQPHRSFGPSSLPVEKERPMLDTLAAFVMGDWMLPSNKITPMKFACLPEEELVLFDVAVAIHKHTLPQQGRLYVCQTLAVFTSPLLTKDILIKFDNIANIEANHDGPIFSALIITTTAGHRLHFLNCPKLDHTVHMLRRLWRGLNVMDEVIKVLHPSDNQALEFSLAVHSSISAGQPRLEQTDGVLLPLSLLLLVAKSTAPLPLLLQIKPKFHIVRAVTNAKGPENTPAHWLPFNNNPSVTYAHVIDFSAPENTVVMPYWMMQSIGVGIGDVIHATAVHLPPLTSVKLRPVSRGFEPPMALPPNDEIADMLLRDFRALSVDAVLPLDFNGKTIEFEVSAVEPSRAVATPLLPTPMMSRNENTQDLLNDVKRNCVMALARKIEINPEPVIKPHEVHWHSLSSTLSRGNVATADSVYFVAPLDKKEGCLIVARAYGELEMFVSTINRTPSKDASEWSLMLNEHTIVELFPDPSRFGSSFVFVTLRAYLAEASYEIAILPLSLDLMSPISSIKSPTSDANYESSNAGQLHIDFAYVQAQRKFLDDLIDISWKMRPIEESQRQSTLVKFLSEFNETLPLEAYLPLGFSNQLRHVVAHIPTTEAHYFSTWDKVPYLICVELIDTEGTCGDVADHWTPSMTSSTVEDRLRYLTTPRPKMETQLTSVQLLLEPPKKHRRPLSRAKAPVSLQVVEGGGGGHSRSSSLNADNRSPSKDASPKIGVDETSSGYDPAVIDRVFGPKWEDRCEQVRKNSPFGHLPGWRLVSIIVKAHDDLRQEQFAMQLISTFGKIWSDAGLSLQLRPYKILATTDDAGIIETIPDALSIHSIKKRMKEAGHVKQLNSFKEFFIKLYGGPKTPEFMVAQNNFVESVAAYSLVCYFLQVKDRHNGNILMDREGHQIHIDYGWMLDNQMPITIEWAPFKLTEDMVDIMGPLFEKYCQLYLEGFLAARREAEKVLVLVEMMANAGLQCIQPTTLVNFRDRFQLNRSEKDCRAYVDSLIAASRNAISTNAFELFQYLYANIY